MTNQRCLDQYQVRLSGLSIDSLLFHNGPGPTQSMEYKVSILKKPSFVRMVSKVFVKYKIKLLKDLCLLLATIVITVYYQLSKAKIFIQMSPQKFIYHNLDGVTIQNEITALSVILLSRGIKTTVIIIRQKSYSEE